MTLEEYEIESFRQSGLMNLFPLLRSGILHRTGIQGYRGIQREGHIIANQGQYPYSYPQSRTYFAHSKGYISLFDFESAEEEDCISIHHTWGHFFCDHKPVTIVLRLDREALKPDLIPNSAAPRLGCDGYKGYIPYVEVWFPKPIPVSAVESYIITFEDRRVPEFIFEEFTSERFEEFKETLSQIEEMWKRISEEAETK